MKKKSQKEKNKTKRKELINKSRRSPNISRSFLISKWGLFNQISK